MIWLGPLSLLLAIARDLQIRTEATDHEQLVRAIVAKLTQVEQRFRVWMQTPEGSWALRALLNNVSGGDIESMFREGVGAELLGIGAKRVAIRISPEGRTPGFVLKLGHFRPAHAAMDNVTEVALWRWAQENQGHSDVARTLTQLLVPPRLYSKNFSWVVYDLAERPSFDRMLELRPEDVAVSRALTEAGVRDVRRRNLGLVDDELRMLDYAWLDGKLTNRVFPGREDLLRHSRQLVDKYGRV